MKYRREIDGLRAVAVVPVILFHAGFSWIGGGFVGVDVFFVISGYLITTIILRELGDHRFTIASFYERRARRILPALFLVLIASCLAAEALLLPDRLERFYRSVISVSFFVSNIHFRNEVDYFAPSADEQPLLHTWSLAVEEQYYLAFPLLMILVWRRGKRAFLVVSGLIALLSFLWADAWSLIQPDKAFFDTRGRVWELFLGALVAYYLLQRRDDEPSVRVAEIGSALGLALIVSSFFLFDRETPFPGRFALVPTIGAALVILFAHPGTLAGRLLASRLAVGMGLISYSAYLWHQPVFAFARLASPSPLSTLLLAFLSALSLGMAYLSWRFVEQPFRNREYLGRRQIFGLSAVGLVGFTSVAIVGVLFSGPSTNIRASDNDLLVSQQDRSHYVMARREKLKDLGGFNRDADHRVLIVGDSYSEDLLNVVAEGGLFPGSDIRHRYIPARCQIYKGDEPIDKFVSIKDRKLCSKDYYQELDELVDEADLTILTASWTRWAAERLPDTIAALGLPQDRVLVIGRKAFGTVKPAVYLKMDPGRRSSIKNPVPEEHLQINDFMSRTLDPTMFVDLHAVICGQDARECPIFSAEGLLLSYDGYHLTKAGAEHVGRLLRDNRAFHATEY